MKKLKAIISKILLILITISIVCFSIIPQDMFVYGATDQELQQQIVSFAESWIGVTPYRFGESSLITGTDCSGFVMLVYAKFGINLPHSTALLLNVGSPVTYDQIQPGDVIITTSSGSPTGRHTGIYAGGGQWVHCSMPHSNPTLDTVKNVFSTSYWTILGIRRIIGTVPSDGSTPDTYPDDTSGPGLFHDFKPQGEIDQKEVDLDAKIFEFAGNPSKVEYTNPSPVRIQWLFSKISQFVDYILGIAITGLKGAVVGWTSIIENWVNSALRLLSGK